MADSNKGELAQPSAFFYNPHRKSDHLASVNMITGVGLQAIALSPISINESDIRP